MSYHTTIIMGNMGHAPEPLGDDGATRFSVAVNETWFREGKKSEHTEWYRVTAAQRFANMMKHFNKGDRILVQGRMRTRQSGDKTYTNLIADRINFVTATGGETGESFP